MITKIKQSSDFIKKKIALKPEVGIILGTGLGGLVKEIENIESINYDEIPNFPISTVEGHSGKLIFGKLGGKNVVAMQGRFHFYEGYSMEQVTFPVRVLKELGIKTLLLSNASGGVNPNFEIGDLMIISDHINLIPNPLIGKNFSELGLRFVDMINAYDKILIEKAEKIATQNNISIKKGIYTATTGPTFETPAEYYFFRVIGSDTVGMSTAPEVVVARHMNIPCFAISIITDLGVPGKIVEISHEEVQQVAQKSEQKMTIIFKKLIQEL